MKRPIYILLLLLFPVIHTYAQPNSYAGKKLLLKTNAIHGTTAFFTGLDAEWVLTRMTTITVGGHYYPERIPQVYAPSIYKKRLLDNCEWITRMPERAKVWTTVLNFEVRIYNNASMLPPPYGFFMYTSLSGGELDILEGAYNRAAFEYSPDGCLAEFVSYTYENIPFLLPEAGIGIQRVFGNRFSAGVKSGLNRGIYFNTLQGLPQAVSQGVFNTYPGNIYSWRKFGFSAYGQIGVFLF